VSKFIKQFAGTKIEGLKHKKKSSDIDAGNFRWGLLTAFLASCSKWIGDGGSNLIGDVQVQPVYCFPLPPINEQKEKIVGGGGLRWNRTRATWGADWGQFLFLISIGRMLLRIRGGLR
jgi:hypothetical protein